MSSLTEALDRIENWLLQNIPDVIFELQKGLSREEIDILIEDYPFKFSQELYELYGWHNGCTSLSFIFDYCDFPSLQKALKYYERLLSWGENDDKLNWLPILNGDKHYYVAVLEEASTPIYWINAGYSTGEFHWNSLSDLMTAVAECYETGAYSVNCYGVEEDERETLKIHRKYGYRGKDGEISISESIDLNSPDALEKLELKLKQTRDAWVAQKLGELGDIRAVDSLILALNYFSLKTRVSAIEALGKLGDLRAVEPLLECLKSSSYLVRIEAALTLQKLNNFSIEETIVECLQSNDYLAFTTATSLLSELDNTRAIELLVLALENTHNYIREKAALALKILKDKKAIEPLLKALNNERCPFALIAIVTALRDLKADMAVEPLIEIFCKQSKKKQPTGDYSFYIPESFIIDVLCSIDNPKSTEFLRSILQDRDNFLLHYKLYGYDSLSAIPKIVQTLLNRQCSEIIERSIELIQDDERQVRAEILSALTYIDDERIFPLLILGLSDRDDRLRGVAIRSVGERRILEAIDRLIELLKDENNDIRLETVKALGNFSDLRITEALIGVLNDENFNVRSAAILALVNLGDSRSIEPIKLCLQDESSIVRKLAARALQKLTLDRE